MKTKTLRKMTFTSKGRPDNMTKLRDQLVDTQFALSQGVVDPSQAEGIQNIAGKIIGSTKVQIDYARARRERPVIPYLK